MEVPELFRKGGPLYGVLQPCGMGSAVDGPVVVGDVGALFSDRLRSNSILASHVRADEQVEELHKLIGKDVAQGWMTAPVPASEVHPEEVRAVPGRGVAQLKADGSTKVRAVFDYSWCAPGPESQSKRLPRKIAKEHSINGCTWLPEKCSHDHLDDLVCFCRQLVLVMGIVPMLFKADIASAFRRIPLLPAHRWAAGIMYQHGGRVMRSTHLSCPFGATASVFNWERVGRFLRKVARKLLHIALFEYVDDYFAAERPEVAEHAMLCFARIVRAVLGKTAIAADKLLFGSTLEVLGVVIRLSHDRFTMCPCELKLRKCLDVMLAALAEGGVLRRGCASKLAGKLQWSCQYLFHRLGRAMLRPIFAQSHASDRSVGSALRVALRWWCKVLELGIVEERFWNYPEAPLAHMFVDACGKSAR
jgi:hypothetical protein